MLILHFVGFFAIIIPLWITAPRTPAKRVFTEFQNNGEWPNMGLSVLIGLTGPVYSMIASDCAVHMGMLDPPSPFPLTFPENKKAKRKEIIDAHTNSRRNQRRLPHPPSRNGLVDDHQRHFRPNHDPHILFLHRRH